MTPLLLAECGYTCKVNEKSDIYSFGVVLMELITGRRPREREFGDDKDIVSWVSGKMRSEECVIDASIHKAFKEDVEKVLRIALRCTAKFPAMRPSMRMVVQMLEEAEPCKLSSIAVDRAQNSTQGNGQSD